MGRSVAAAAETLDAIQEVQDVAEETSRVVDRRILPCGAESRGTASCRDARPAGLMSEMQRSAPRERSFRLVA